MRFTNKTVFITGAAGGIGRQTGLSFAKEGANVVVSVGWSVTVGQLHLPGHLSIGQQRINGIKQPPFPPQSEFL